MKVLFDDLETGFLSSNEEISNWVDRKTGKVIFIGSESVVGDIFIDDEDERQATNEILILCGEIKSDETIEIDENRYLKINPPDSNEKWKWMEEFTLHQVSNIVLQNKLADALSGKKPFRKFKDILLYHPETQKNWFAFENKNLREFIKTWAKANQIDFDKENDS
jgi:Uncharacterised protein family (UPF0158)